MTHSAMNAPVCQNAQPSTVERKTGSPTTNQTSRAPKRNSRATESTFTARLRESRWLNFAFLLAVPRSPRIISEALTNASTTRPRITPTDAWNPISESSRPPRKNPTPLSAFLLPVSSATQR